MENRKRVKGDGHKNHIAVFLLGGSRFFSSAVSQTFLECQGDITLDSVSDWQLSTCGKFL
jgi:hypothetical protein